MYKFNIHKFPFYNKLLYILINSFEILFTDSHVLYAFIIMQICTVFHNLQF